MTNNNIPPTSPEQKSEMIQRFNRMVPCPVCQSGTKGCSETANGLIFCRGKDSAPFGFIDCGLVKEDSQFHCFRRTNQTTPVSARKTNSLPNKVNWEQIAKECQRQLTPNRRATALKDCLVLGLVGLIEHDSIRFARHGEPIPSNRKLVQLVLEINRDLVRLKPANELTRFESEEDVIPSMLANVTIDIKDEDLIR